MCSILTERTYVCQKVQISNRKSPFVPEATNSPKITIMYKDGPICTIKYIFVHISNKLCQKVVICNSKYRFVPDQAIKNPDILYISTITAGDCVKFSWLAKTCCPNIQWFVRFSRFFVCKSLRKCCIQAKKWIYFM